MDGTSPIAPGQVIEGSQSLQDTISEVSAIDHRDETSSPLAKKQRLDTGIPESPAFRPISSINFTEGVDEYDTDMELGPHFDQVDNEGPFDIDEVPVCTLEEENSSPPVGSADGEGDGEVLSSSPPHRKS